MTRNKCNALGFRPWLIALICAPALVQAAGERAAAVGRHAPVIRRVFNSASRTQLPANWTIAGQPYASVSEYQNLRDGCMEILRRYPPDKHYFVGLGRDPAPVIAFLQNLGDKELAVNLPGTSNIGWANTGLQPADVARHVEAAIPKHILAGDRTIVILDVTATGKTPAIFGPFMDQYLRSRGSKTKVVRLALSWNDVLTQGNYSSAGLEWIDTRRWPDFLNYYGGKYEGSWTPAQGGMGIAEHQRHMMGPGIQPPTATNPNYAEFRKVILARMEQDQELDQFLVENVNLDALAAARYRAGKLPERPRAPWMPQFRSLKQPRKQLGDGALLSLKVEIKPEKKEKKKKGQVDNTTEAESPPQGPTLVAMDYLSEDQYTEFRHAGLTLLHQFAPEKHFFIGVGRSSSPLVAFLENLGDRVATYLPIDGLHKQISKGVISGTLPLANKQIFFRLFEAFLPKEVLSGDRQVVLFQQSDSGASLPFLQGLLAEYFAQQKSQAQVKVVAYAAEPPSSGIPFIDVSQSVELKQMNTAKYHAVAAYPYFRLGSSHYDLEQLIGQNGKDSSPKPRSTNFGRFKDAMRERMQHDAVLKTSIGEFTSASEAAEKTLFDQRIAEWRMWRKEWAVAFRPR